MLVHHDPSTFLAGKLHAIFQRGYTKGRDYYDLFFFLSRWPLVEPNIEYLENALDQTGYQGEAISRANWRRLVAEQVKRIDWASAARDVTPFLLRTKDAEVFQQDLLLRLLDAQH